MKRILIVITLAILASIIFGCATQKKAPGYSIVIDTPQKTFSRATTQKDTVNVKPFEDLTLVTDGTVDTSDQFLIYDISAGLFSYRLSLGELLKKAIDVPNIVGSSQIVNGSILDTDISGSAGIGLNKLATTAAGRLLLTDSGGAGTWVSGTPGYGLTISGTSMLADTLSASGLVSKSRLTNALDDVSTGSTSLGYLDVTNYGAVVNDGTDDTAAIQAAINAAYNQGGGVVYFPVGTYNIDGPIVTSDNKGNNPNSQIYIPASSLIDADTNLTIKLLGELPPSTINPHGKFGRTKNNRDGVLLYSSGEGSNANSAIIGTIGDSTNALGTWNFTELHIENIGFQVKNNPNGSGIELSGLNLGWQVSVDLRNVEVSVDTIAKGMTEPADNYFGIQMGYTYCSPRQNAKNVRIEGFEYGIICSDHAVVTETYVAYCTYAYVVTDAAHTIHMDRILSQRNRYVFYYKSDDGNPYASSHAPVLTVDNLSLEPGYADNSPAYVLGSERVSDATNSIIGHIHYFNPQAVGNGTGGSNIRWFNLDISSSDFTVTGNYLPGDDATANLLSKLDGMGYISNSASQTTKPTVSGATDDVVLRNLVTALENLGLITSNVTAATFAAGPVDSISSTLVFWADPSQDSYSNGNSVDTIFDYSGNNYDVIQATAGRQPTYQTSIINSLATYSFDGGDWATRSRLTELDEGNDFSIFIVASADVDEDNNVTLSTTSPDTAAANNRIGFFIDTRDANKAMANYDSSATARVLSSIDTLAASTFYIQAFTYEDFTGAAKSYISNTLQDSEFFQSVQDSNQKRAFTIGAQHNASASALNLEGDIAMILIYSSVLTDTERGKVITYLQNRFGL